MSQYRYYIETRDNANAHARVVSGLLTAGSQQSPKRILDRLKKDYPGACSWGLEIIETETGDKQ